MKGRSWPIAWSDSSGVSPRFAQGSEVPRRDATGCSSASPRGPNLSAPGRSAGRLAMSSGGKVGCSVTVSTRFIVISATPSYLRWILTPGFAFVHLPKTRLLLWSWVRPMTPFSTCAALLYSSGLTPRTLPPLAGTGPPVQCATQPRPARTDSQGRLLRPRSFGENDEPSNDSCPDPERGPGKAADGRDPRRSDPVLRSAAGLLPYQGRLHREGEAVHGTGAGHSQRHPAGGAPERRRGRLHRR